MPMQMLAPPSDRHSEISKCLIGYILKDIINVVNYYDYIFEGKQIQSFKNVTYGGSFSDGRIVGYDDYNILIYCPVTNRIHEQFSIMDETNGPIFRIGIISNDRILIAGFDVIKIWNCLTKSDEKILCRDKNITLCLKIISEQWAVVGSADSTMHLLNICENTANNAYTVLRDHTDVVRHILVISDKKFVSGSNDCTLKVWSIEDLPRNQCTMTRTLKGHSYPISCMELLSNCQNGQNGQKIVSGSYNGEIYIWDIDTGELFSTFSWSLGKVLQENKICSIIELPDQTLACGLGDDSIIIISTNETISCLKWSSRFINTTTVDLFNKYYHNGYESYICNVMIDLLPGNQIISGSHGKTIKIWNQSKHSNHGPDGCEKIIETINEVQFIKVVANGMAVVSQTYDNKTNDTCMMVWR